MSLPVTDQGLWSGLQAADPAVLEAAAAMASRDGYRFPRSPGALKNFLPLAEVAVSAVRASDARRRGEATAADRGPCRTLMLALSEADVDDSSPLWQLEGAELAPDG